MPRNIIQKEDFSESRFLSILKERKLTLKKLVESINEDTPSLENITISERTIRRAKEHGKIQYIYLDIIAKKLDIDPRLLTGELDKKADKIKDEQLKQIYLSSLTPDKYPYFRYFKEVNVSPQHQSISDILTNIFSLFDISKKQFDDMTFEEQYELQYDLFRSLIPVINKHFSKDAFGNDGLPNLERILVDLDNYRDEYYQLQHADTILRTKYSKKPPLGYSKKKIQNMTPNEILELDVYIQFSEYNK